jgi:DME family drug/metabolite transporter
VSSVPYSGEPYSGELCPDVSTSRPAHSRIDLVLVVLAGLLWGTGGLVGALLERVADLHPMAVATYRLAGGGLFLLATLAGTGRLPRLTREALIRVLMIGLLVASYQAAYFAAVSLTGLAVSTLITLGAAPVLVLAAEAVLHRRRPDVTSLFAVGLAVVGLALLVGTSGTLGGAALLAGAALALVAAAGFGVLTLLGRRPVVGLDAPAGIGVGFIVGAVLLASVTVPTVGLGFTPSAESIGLLAYFGCVPTALAYGLYFAGLRGVPAGSASVIAVLEPVTATVLGVVLLGDRLDVGEVIGAGLLCAAAVVAGLSRPD